MVKPVFTQTLVDEARVAIALERYRRKYGQYPPALSYLVPEFLDAVPQDWIDGKPLRYKLEGGRFVLYSIGWNAKDDGGRPAWRIEMRLSSAVARPELDQGDWVWTYCSEKKGKRNP